jgi:oligopeptide transport system substrate-binding protein
LDSVRSLARLGALTLAAVLVVGACDDPDPVAEPSPVESETTAEGSPTPTSTLEASPAETPTSSPAPEPEEGGILRVAIPEPSTLDPMRAQDPGSVLLVRQLFEGLTRWDPVAQEVVPAAARSWEIGNEGRRFTFHLRKDLRWHDGRPVTADDFRAAFDRIALRKNASDLAYTLERVEGFIQVNRLGSAKHLRGVQAPDDDTLVIELTQPYYDWPTVLTHPGLVPIPKQAERDIDQFLSKPVGNGSFQMARPWTSGEPVLLKSFADAIKPPFLDGIRFFPFEDAAASWAAFDDGDLDVAEVPVGRFDYAAETYGQDGVKPLLAGYYYGLNLRSKNLRKDRLRKAVTLAIDREEVADEIYKQTMQAPRGVIPAGLPGFEDDSCGSLCEYDPDGAESLVSNLGSKERKVRLEFTRGDPHGRIAETIAGDLRAAGFDVKAHGYAFPAYIERLSRGDQQIFRYGWIAEYPSPDAFLSPLFDSASPDNHSGLNSQRIDRLLDDAHATRNDDKRLELYQAAERAVLRSLVVAPIGTFVSHWAARPEVEGILFDVLGGFDAAGVSLGD